MHPRGRAGTSQAFALDGIGGFFLARDRLGLQIAVLCASEVNPASVRVSKAHCPSARHLGNISGMGSDDLKDILDKAPRATVIVFCGGLPSLHGSDYVQERCWC